MTSFAVLAGFHWQRTSHSSSSSSSLATASLSFCLFVFLPLSFLRSVSTSVSVDGFCSVFSHRRKESTEDKKYFVCCANSEEKQCHSLTYQVPTRTQGFCRGHVTEDDDVGNQQPETDFGYHGNFYCGGCCGQRLAADRCNDEWNRKRKSPGKGLGGGRRNVDDVTCFNWVLCFMRRCEHYMEDMKTHSVNYSLFLHHLLPTTSNMSSFSQGTGLSSPGGACGPVECSSMNMEKQCQHRCCRRYCCLQDGSPNHSGLRRMVGRSVAKATGVVVALVAFVVFVVSLTILLARRCVHVQPLSPAQDSRILVVDDTDEPNDSDTDSV